MPHEIEVLQHVVTGQRNKPIAPTSARWENPSKSIVGADAGPPILRSGQGLRPVHRVYVDGFWMDRTEVTNAQWRQFVDATRYRTIAEIAPTHEQFPTAPLENLVAGSTVFTPTPGPVALKDMFQWWRYQPGANWQHPEGPETTITGRDPYPVVQIAYPDSVAYARWAHKRLPTEAEWEFAARGGRSGQCYAWGDELKPGGKWMANIYQSVCHLWIGQRAIGWHTPEFIATHPTKP